MDHVTSTPWHSPLQGVAPRHRIHHSSAADTGADFGQILEHQLRPDTQPNVATKPNDSSTPTRNCTTDVAGSDRPQTIGDLLSSIILSGQRISYGAGTEGIEHEITEYRTTHGIANPAARYVVEGREVGAVEAAAAGRTYFGDPHAVNP